MGLDKGWRVNDVALLELFEGELPNDLEKKLLDIDMREYGESCLIGVNKETNTLTGPIVLQIVKIRNVSVPKVNEGAHNNNDGLWKMTLTNGHASIHVLLLNTIKDINSNTAPGTKILLTGTIPMDSGFLLPTKANIQVLGGRVERLLEKWIVEQNSFRGDAGRKKESEAPRWVSFGKKISKNPAAPAVKGFRANDVIHAVRRKEQEEGDDDFTEHRKQVIQQAKVERPVKTFTAPTVQVAAPPPRDVPTRAPQRHAPVSSDRGHDRRPKGRGRKGDEDYEPDVPAEFSRPSAPSTLFDFVAQGAGTAFIDGQKVSQHVRESVHENNFRGDRDRPGRNGDSRRGGRESGQRGGRGGRGRGGDDSRRGRGGRGGRESGQRGGFSRPDRDNKPSGGIRELNGRPATDDRSHHNQRASSPRRTFDGRSDGRQGPSNDNQYRQSRNQTSGGFNSRNNDDVYVKRRNEAPPQFDTRSFPSVDEATAKMSSMSMKSPREEYRAHTSQRSGVTRLNTIARKDVPVWKVGDSCGAPWDDGQFYPAQVVYVGPRDMCTVRFQGYDNTITVPQAILLIPMSKLVGATAKVVKGVGRLRPTRAAITLTPEAVSRVKYLLGQKGGGAEALKIGVRQKGCNGLTYTLDYASQKGKFDEEVVQDDVKVWIDAKAQLSLLGTEMDYVTTKLSSEFVFRNPNIKGTCGCGESFSL